MLQFINRTPLQGLAFPAVNADGVDSVYAIVKGAFTLSERPIPLDEQVPISMVDLFYDEPARSSIKTPSDICLEKPGTDVLLHGNAYAPGDRPVAQMDVAMRIGPIAKTVRVFGDRQWGTGGFFGMPKPAPFVTMPLVWERAFGGTEYDSEGRAAAEESRNPVGGGFARSTNDILPNVEDPRQLISSRGARTTPAGFAAICAHWEPRRLCAGTYDEAWAQNRAPYLPQDFDPRFFQLAPPDQVVPASAIRPGEPGELTGVSPRGPLRFAVPAATVRIVFRLDGKNEERQAMLDTILIEPDKRRILLVWRAAIETDKKTLRVREIEAHWRN